MGRSPRCSQEGLNKGAWTALEDKTLIHYINTYGHGKWSNVSKITGLKRCGKSCRLRWMNYLRPDIKRGNITPDEEELILRLHKLLGNRWSLIAGRLPGRTDNEIKNYWNTNLARKGQDNQIPINNNVTNSDQHHLVSMNPLEPVPTNTKYDPSSDPMGPLLSSLQLEDVDANNSNTNLLLLSNGTVKSESSDRSSEEDTPNFMIDFSVDDIYHILDPDFVSGLNNVEALPEGEEEDNANPGADMGPDFPSLASFLESDAWLGDEDNVNVTSN